ncbi:MAG: tRNA lysidine(34) synthetase TilS [Lachnospiraceae bacterium]|nr:tRNA lysidine(34) synthetase TilS [Lachnospiraceae bacterium]
MYRKFVQFIEKHELLKQNEKLVVGVSGGADSVCLLSLLCKLREEMDFDITVVHVNHGIREEAGEDAQFVEKLCFDYGVPFVLKEVSVNDLAKQWNMSTEEAGRKVRYEAFSEVLGNADGKIVVAHNQNDVAETVLFNLFRGSGSTGLGGISVKKGRIVRPLLCFLREEIETYLEENQLNYCIDKTNLTDDYTRNKIRNHILPYVEKEIVKGSVSHIYNTAGLLKEQDEYLEHQVQKELESVTCFEKESTICSLDKEAFSKLHVFMQKKILHSVLCLFAGSQKDITGKHIESVLSLFHKDGMKFVDLPYNLQAKCEYEKVVIGKRNLKDGNGTFECGLETAKGFTFRIFSAKMPDTVPEKTYTKWFDYDKIEESLVVRTRKEGDYLLMQDGQHRKSLSRYFIDEKVPKDKRDEILLLADGPHIVWVIGGRISDYYKITDKTKQIIEILYDGGF